MKKILTYILASVIVSNLYAQSYSITAVYTPNGTSVEGLALTSPDYTTNQKASIKSQTLNQYPNITFLGDATLTYNCHGYTWNLSEGGSNVVWINATDVNYNPNIAKYWTDGSFIQVCNESDADKIYYYTGDHSAVSSTVVVGKYESKWGSGILARHDPTDVPSIYNAQYRKYYASTAISGSYNVCGSTTYSAKQITGATYVWDKMANLTLSGSGHSVTVTPFRVAPVQPGLK